MLIDQILQWLGSLGQLNVGTGLALAAMNVGCAFIPILRTLARTLLRD